MATASDIESYMVGMGLDFQALEPGLWLVQDEGDSVENIVVSLIEPIVLFRVKLFDLPGGEIRGLCRLLLELNASEMIHGAYGLEGTAVVMVDTLQSENLDLNEFQASIEAMSLSMLQHYPRISAELSQMEAGQ